MNTRQIAKDYDLKIIYITKNNLDNYSKKYNIEKEDLQNNAYVIGDEEIILGIYEDKDLRIAAFFHEIGHTLISDKFLEMINHDLMLVEYQAWIEGLKVAKKYGHKFSNKTFKYILKSVNSYYKDALCVYNKKTKK